MASLRRLLFRKTTHQESGEKLFNRSSHQEAEKVILEFGFLRKLICDGGPELCQRFQDWYKKAVIKVEVSSAYRAMSNARAEECIKQVKILLEKTKDGGEDFALALTEYCNAPRADGPCINDLFYNRQTRSCVSPKLQREVQIEEKQRERRRQEIKGRVERTKRLPLPPLPRDSEVWMMDKSNKWTIPAKVLAARPNGKSYILETNKGIYLRKRKYLRPKNAKEEEEHGEAEECNGQRNSEESTQGEQTQQIPMTYAQVAASLPRQGPVTRTFL